MTANQRRAALQRAQGQLGKPFVPFRAGNKYPAQAAADKGHIIHLQKIDPAVPGAGDKLQRLLVLRKQRDVLHGALGVNG